MSYHITCPYCGYQDRDSWESGLRDGDTDEVDCKKCERPFYVTCEMTIEYLSEPKPTETKPK